MLSGPLPSEIGNLFLLESLALGNNAFDGIMPTELGQLAAIRTLQCALFFNVFPSRTLLTIFHSFSSPQNYWNSSPTIWWDQFLHSWGSF